MACSDWTTFYITLTHPETQNLISSSTKYKLACGLSFVRAYIFKWIKHDLCVNGSQFTNNDGRLKRRPIHTLFVSLPCSSFMAPTLTSNSFLLTTAPQSRTSLKHHRPTVSAKKAGVFSPSAKKSDEGGENSSPFRFDFGNLPDVKSLVPVVSNPSQGLSFGQRRKDTGTVFVAGATGQLGIRIAQTLLREGFSVRAGVPDLVAAQELARLAVSYKVFSYITS